MFGSLGEGFFGMLAKEVGDEQTARALLAWADGNLNPVEKDGFYYFPRDDSRKVSPLTGILLACARANVKDGFWALHNRPWTAEHFAKPFVSDVPYPRAIVTRAVWDEGEGALVLTLLPGEPNAEKASFAVRNLDPSDSWSIEKGGAPLAAVRSGKVTGPGAGSAVTWADGVLRVTTSLAAEETFVLMRQERAPRRTSDGAETPR
jgi:hypothetical protein